MAWNPCGRLSSRPATDQSVSTDHNNDTICAIATPPGEGGIGIVRLSGPRSLGILCDLYRSPRGRKVIRWQSHLLVLGFIVDPLTGERVDEVFCVYMQAPRSYTGEDIVEIHGHGGAIPLRRIVDLALRLGARMPSPGEYTLRAFLNGRLDLAQAESVIDVIRARTDTALRTAMGGYAGKLSGRVRILSERILDWIAQLEATLDFPEDDVPAHSSLTTVATADSVLTELDRLLAGAEQGRLLRDGVRVAIVGKPNVGKSSLLNALLGEARAIVTEIPGTTRDSIEEWLNVHGIPMRVVDTAGIRHSNDRVEAIGIERARVHLELADLALLVLDATGPPNEEDAHIAAISAGRPRLVVVNKIDAADAFDIKPFERLADGDPCLLVSATNGAGVGELTRAMSSRLSQGLTVADEVVGGNLRHRDALYRAREHIARARDTAAAGLQADFVTIDLKEAVDALGEITGTRVTEEIVARIFSQFCLGK